MGQWLKDNCKSYRGCYESEAGNVIDHDNSDL